jgi:hypothetical protein
MESIIFWDTMLCSQLKHLVFITSVIQAIYSYETSVDFQRITRRYIPEDNTLHNHRCENLET